MTWRDRSVIPSCRPGGCGSAYRGQAFFDRQGRIAGPFVPGAEIHPDILHAGVLERQQGVRCPRALEAIEVDRRFLADPDGGAFGEDLVARLEARAFGRRLHHAVPLEPDGAWDAALARAEILAVGR